MCSIFSPRLQFDFTRLLYNFHRLQFHLSQLQIYFTKLQFNLTKLNHNSPELHLNFTIFLALTPIIHIKSSSTITHFTKTTFAFTHLAHYSAQYLIQFTASHIPFHLSTSHNYWKHYYIPIIYQINHLISLNNDLMTSFFLYNM